MTELEKLQKIMVENGLTIRAIPKTIKDTVELRHSEEYPSGHKEYLLPYGREMWVYERHPINGGRFIVESNCGTNTIVKFYVKKFYESIEEIIEDYS